MSGQSGFADPSDLYQDIILERSRNPRHMRCMEDFDASAKGDNPLCGDRIEVRVKRAADGKIADIAYQARGCAISLASADLMADAMRGRGADEIGRLAEDFRSLVNGGDAGSDVALDMLRPLSGVSEYRSRIKCATLPWNALLATLGKSAREAGQ